MAYQVPSSGAYIILETAPIDPITGDGTAYRLVCDHVIYNPLNEYDTTTGIFTPSGQLGGGSAKYLINIQISLTGIIATNTTFLLSLVDPGVTYYQTLENMTIFPITNADGTFGCTSSTVVLLANDIPINIELQVAGNPTPNVNLVGSNEENPYYTSVSFIKLD